MLALVLELAIDAQGPDRRVQRQQVRDQRRAYEMMECLDGFGWGNCLSGQNLSLRTTTSSIDQPEWWTPRTEIPNEDSKYFSRISHDIKFDVDTMSRHVDVAPLSIDVVAG